MNIKKTATLFVTLTILVFYSYTSRAQDTRFYAEMSHHVDDARYVDAENANNIYKYFKNSVLFHWFDKNNCEDRANAVSLLLDSWNIPNYKAWVFSGSFLQKDNGLLITYKNIRWKYHVATVIPIKKSGQLTFIVIDPATTRYPVETEAWAKGVTKKNYSYYFITPNKYYIWYGRGKDITGTTFYQRGRQNFTWTMEGLAGFNGLNSSDQEQMKTSAGKKKLKDTRDAFTHLKTHKPKFD